MPRAAALAALLIAGLSACQPAQSAPAAEKASSPVSTPEKPAAKPGAKAPLPKDALVLKRAKITDPGVIRKGNALTILVPDGWTTRGGIESKNDFCSEFFGVNWTAASPDGQSTFLIFPTEGWQASNTPLQSTCMNASFQSTGDYLAARIQYMYPGAKILGYTPREDFSRDAQEFSRRIQQMSAQNGLNMQVWADGGEMSFSFKQNGKEMHGMLAATTQFYVSSVYDPWGGPPMQSLTAATLGTFGATAPEGQLNAKLAEAVRRSVTPDADWLKAYFKITAQRGQINVQAAEERAGMIVAGGAAATKANIEAFRNMTAATAANGMPDPIKTGSGGTVSYSSEASDDRRQRESIEAVRGVETYYDETGEQNVQLDATYDHAWRVTNNDTYILTNDPNFNPGAFDIQATEMKVVK